MSPIDRLNQRLLVFLGLSPETAQIVMDRVSEQEATIVALREQAQRLERALQAVADEAGRHHEYNSVSGVARLPMGYLAILSIADNALVRHRDTPDPARETHA